MRTIEWLPTEYIYGDETVEPCIIDGKRIIYCHFKNGYYSLIEGIANLLNFLNGDTSERFFCADNFSDIQNFIIGGNL